MGQPVWIVENVKARDDYTLLITFTGGAQRVYDARPLLAKGIFAPLKSLAFFLRAKALYGVNLPTSTSDSFILFPLAFPPHLC